MALFKAQAHARDLQQRLQILVPTAVFNATPTAPQLDALGFPIISFTHAGETQWIYITTEYAAETGAPVGSDPNGGQGATPSNHVDGLGLPQRVYSPHMCQVYREAIATPPADNNGQNAVLAAVALMGMKVLIWEGTGVESTTTLAGAQAAATTLVTKVPSDYINPLTNSQ